MAEMLVDGAKLDACNTAEADAIRAKTGGTDPIPYDYANSKGFADAIAAIPTGGGGSGINKYVYTHAQDWTSVGTTRRFFETYFINGDGMYYATIENNSASGDFKAISATASIGFTRMRHAAFERTVNDATTIDSGWSFYISAGATITVWFMPKGEFV